jgi:hypothetical protein
MQTMILRAESGSEFIEASEDSASLYVLFSSKNRDKGNLPFVCKTDDLTLNKQLLNKTAKTAANNKVLIRYDWLYLVRVNMQLTMAERRKSTCGNECDHV